MTAPNSLSDVLDAQDRKSTSHVRREALTRSNRHPNRLARWTFRLGVAVCVLIVGATAVGVTG